MPEFVSIPERVWRSLSLDYQQRRAQWLADFQRQMQEAEEWE